MQEDNLPGPTTMMKKDTLGKENQAAHVDKRLKTCNDKGIPVRLPELRPKVPLPAIPVPSGMQNLTGMKRKLQQQHQQPPTLAMYDCKELPKEKKDSCNNKKVRTGLEKIDTPVKPLSSLIPQRVLPQPQPQQLHLCLKLYDKTEARDIQWGNAVKANHEIGVLIKNPNPMQIKALCSVNREDGTQLPIKGSKAAEIDPQKAMVLCLFTPQLDDKKIILSYLANQTPVVKGKGVYYTRLIVGIEPDDDEPTVVSQE